MPTWTKEQSLAITTSGKNIIVSAGAGSGKTAVLSERVINKLNNGIHIDELLILTFTRAAAEEMKDRIRRKIAKNPDFKDELDRVDSAYITTFDSFALSVVKKYHYLLGLKSDIGVCEETIISLEKTKILDEVFNEFYVSADESFSRLIQRYSLKNDTMLKSAILELSEKIGSYLDRDDYLTNLKNSFYSEENIAKIIEEFKHYVDTKKHTLSLELSNAYYYFDEDYNNSLTSIIAPIINSTTLDELASYKNVKLPNLKRGSDDEAKKAKEDLKLALTDLLFLTEFGNEQKIREDILSTKETTDCIINILESYFKKLDAYKTQNDMYTFTDIASLAIKVLQEFETARLELKNKFKEIMIDEYQDTNDVQETFISLIADNNVYMVGDIKQSIYRFRGSNPSIFKSKYDHYSSEDGGTKIDLIKNFRSRSEVLENINRIFDLLMDDNLGGAKYTESHEMVYGNTTYDEHHMQDYDYNFEVLEYIPLEDKSFSNIEVEIFAIAKDIQKKKKSGFQVFDKNTNEMRPFNYSDAVIILDRSKYFDDFKRIFEYLGIPLAILKDDKLSTAIDLNILKNLIELLCRIKNGDFGPEFRYAFLSIGRSYLYEYTDEYLFDILENRNYKDTTLYQDIANIEDYNSKTIYELISSLIETTHLYDKLHKVGEYENTCLRIEKVLNLASSLGESSYTIEDFRDYLNEVLETELDIKYTAFTGDADAVKILTIHKSKGLEYPLCYFADLDHDFNTRELKNKFIVDKKYGLITSIENEFGETSDSVLKLLYKSSFMTSEIGEKIRLFYVALTRAREKMIIVIPKKDTRKLEKNEIGTIEETRRLKFKSLGDFIYGVRDYLDSYFKTLDINSLELTKNYLYTKTNSLSLDSPSNIDFTVEELNIETSLKEEKTFSKNSLDLIDKKSKSNMLLGTKMHEALEYTDFKNFDANIIKDEFIKSNITRFLSHPLFKNIKDAKIYKEFEFIYEQSTGIYHGIIDLMLEYNDHIDIIDYKLKSTIDAAYKEQLKGYKSYIQTISDKKINTYLYSIIDGTINEIEIN